MRRADEPSNYFDAQLQHDPTFYAVLDRGNCYIRYPQLVAQYTAALCRPLSGQRKLKCHHLHFWNQAVSFNKVRATAHITPLSSPRIAMPLSQTSPIPITRRCLPKSVERDVYGLRLGKVLMSEAETKTLSSSLSN